jgi:hypothetical protein
MIFLMRGVTNVTFGCCASVYYQTQGETGRSNRGWTRCLDNIGSITMPWHSWYWWPVSGSLSCWL